MAVGWHLYANRRRRRRRESPSTVKEAPGRVLKWKDGNGRAGCIYRHGEIIQVEEGVWLLLLVVANSS